MLSRSVQPTNSSSFYFKNRRNDAACCVLEHDECLTRALTLEDVYIPSSLRPDELGELGRPRHTAVVADAHRHVESAAVGLVVGEYQYRSRPRPLSFHHLGDPPLASWIGQSRFCPNIRPRFSAVVANRGYATVLVFSALHTAVIKSQIVEQRTIATRHLCYVAFARVLSKIFAQPPRLPVVVAEKGGRPIRKTPVGWNHKTPRKRSPSAHLHSVTVCGGCTRDAVARNAGCQVLWLAPSSPAVPRHPRKEVLPPLEPRARVRRRSVRREQDQPVCDTIINCCWVPKLTKPAVTKTQLRAQASVLEQKRDHLAATRRACTRFLGWTRSDSQRVSPDQL